MRRIQTVHLIGIGGGGMSGIAEVLLNLGYTVTGSDIARSPMTERLAGLGALVTYSHVAENVANCDAVVVSSAIAADNPEVATAKLRRIPVVPRAQMLAELMRFKQGIAIAGTHGKTTTTSLLATLFANAGLDPTFVIGGLLNSLGANAKLGQGQYFIAEADESDRSFLHLNPSIAVVTNIDREHLGTYDNDFDQLKKTFLQFIHKLPFYGLAVLCLDCPVIRELLPLITRPYITYGFSPDADVRALSWQSQAGQTQLTCAMPGIDTPIPVQLKMAGRHNAQNALAALAVGAEAGINVADLSQGFSNFQGVGRRMQILGKYKIDGKPVMLMDDYGHHPKEVAAVLAALQHDWPSHRIVMIYQPHRYTRTRDLFQEFVQVLAKADKLLLLDIYPASESPISGISSLGLAEAIQQHSPDRQPLHIAAPDELFAQLRPHLRAGDLVLTQGAGSIGRVARALAQQFAHVQQVVLEPEEVAAVT